MNHEELFVGGVSVVLGVVAMLAAVSNGEVYYQLRKIQWIEAMGGRWVARAVYAVLGAVLITLGVAIALGFGPNSSSATLRWKSHRGGPSRSGVSPPRFRHPPPSPGLAEAIF